MNLAFSVALLLGVTTSFSASGASQDFRAIFAELQAKSERQGAAADDLYSISTKEVYGTAADAQSGGGSIGQILAATRMEVLERDGDLLKVVVEGWQQDEVDRAIYELRGQRILSVSVRNDAVDRIERQASETDPNTDILWHQVRLEGWVNTNGLIDSVGDIWEYGAAMNSAACGTCHAMVSPDRLLANQWTGMMRSKQRSTPLDREEFRFLTKYLQMHAGDTSGAAKQ